MPDLEAAFAALPKHGLNVHHEEACAESRAWINRFNKAMYGPKMRAFMENCNFELLNTFCYLYAGKAGLRAAMDFANLVYLYDEFTDTKSGQDASKSASVFLAALRNYSFDDESWLCLLVKDFKERHIDRAGSGYKAGIHISEMDPSTTTVAQKTYSSTTFLMPDLEAAFAALPLPKHGLNVHHEEACAESRAWINRFNKTVYGPKMRAFMENANFELFSTFCYPYAGKDGLRTAMDLTNMLWLYDEFTDTETGQEAYKSASVVEQALRDPNFDDGSWLCLERHLDRAGPDTARRAIEHLCSYVQLVGKEAELREREEGIFDLVEICLDINFAQEIFEDPVFISGYNAAMDLTYWANDLYSYDMEQAKGHDGSNAITVIMKSRGLSLQAAVDFLGGYCDALIDQWQTARGTLAGRPGEKYRDAVRALDAFVLCTRGSVA
ncbi:terpenoid synthase [Hymenopellis radicata]|nr:terpenoid synthase [Hymenopellis radicata]